MIQYLFLLNSNSGPIGLTLLVESKLIIIHLIFYYHQKKKSKPNMLNKQWIKKLYRCGGGLLPACPCRVSNQLLI